MATITDAPRRATATRSLSPDLRFLSGLGRAFAGALIFSIPLLMTMEMWSLGVTMERSRLILVTFMALPLLVGLSHYVGFEKTFELKQDVVDTFVALTVAFITATSVLVVFNIIQAGMDAGEVVGKIVIQVIPASIGALLAQAQLGNRGEDDQQEQENTGYSAELFHIMVGALFLALNLAPTEEIILIGYRMTEWQAVALAVVSILIMHGFVYIVDFRGGHTADTRSRMSVFVRYTVTGYAVVLLVSAYVLWTFGRLDGSSAHEAVTSVVVLGLPAAIGGAAARLIL